MYLMSTSVADFVIGAFIAPLGLYQVMGSIKTLFDIFPEKRIKS